MGAKKQKANRNSFIMFTYSMMNSPAYKALSASACKALPFFLAKVKIHVGNDDRYKEIFSLSYGELKASTEFSDKTCASVYRELVRVGFIHPISKGGLRGFGKTTSKYKLSRRWEQFGQPGFSEVDLRKFGT